VPITLAILGYRLQQIQQNHTDEVAKEQRELAANEAKEEVLQVYFDRLSALLVDKNLLAIANNINSEEQEKSQTTPEEQELLASAVDVIRARTLSILRRFENDKERKTSVIRFLIEADFISKLNLDLSGADLSGAILIGANLSSNSTNLSGADLRLANLGWVKLFVANLSGADLSGANLSRANFNGANFRKVTLKGADLSWATLSEAKGLLDEQIKSADKWENATYNGKRLDNAEVRKQLVLNTDP
jgi:uncharacterized protein YjbI with pentapeptide repeats